MKYLFLTYMLFSTAFVYGQTPQVSREKSAAIQILKQIGLNLNHELLFNTPDNNAFLISIGIFINKNGNIEDSFYSQNSEQAYSKILNITALSGKLKVINFRSYGYTDCVLILPILFKHADAVKIENGEEFLKSYSNLWPEIPSKYKNKKVNLLPPEINLYFKPIR